MIPEWTDEYRAEVVQRVADKLRREHPDFDWANLARTLLPLYEHGSPWTGKPLGEPMTKAVDPRQYLRPESGESDRG